MSCKMHQNANKARKYLQYHPFQARLVPPTCARTSWVVRGSRHGRANCAQGEAFRCSDIDLDDIGRPLL